MMLQEVHLEGCHSIPSCHQDCSTCCLGKEAWSVKHIRVRNTTSCENLSALLSAAMLFSARVAKQAVPV